MSSKPLYNPLDESRVEIRLLEIISSGINATPECKLHVVSLEDKPKFTTLSYVWGDAKATEEILVDGSSTIVTTSLATALRYVKGHWQATYPNRNSNEFKLWADGLCINQADLSERQSQVQLMRSIYLDAELMISWLGCGIDSIDTAFETFRIIGEETQQQDKIVLDWLEQYPTWFIHEPPDPRGTVSALSDFSNLSYWRRVWIFQELVLAQRICFANGISRAYLEELHKGARWLHRMTNAVDEGLLELPREADSLLGIKGWFELERFDEVRKRFRLRNTLPESDIEYLYTALGDLQATDPRDQIYGLLGILDTDITPNYNETLTNVYHHYVERYLSSTHSLRFLNSAGIGRFDYDSAICHPSWAPDFAEKAKQRVPQRMGFWGLRMTFLYGWSDLDLFQSLDYLDLPRKDGSIIQTVAYLPTRVVTVHGKLSELSYNDSTLFRFICGQVNSGLWNTRSLHHPVEQIFRALVPDSIMESELGEISQALAFLMLILRSPWDDRFTEDEQMSIRMAQLGFPLLLPAGDQLLLNLNHFGSPLQNGFASRLLRWFNFQGHPKSIDHVNRLVREQGYLGNSHIRILQGLCSTQVFYRFATLSNGYVGLVPRFSRQDDILTVVKGCNIPLILREKDDHYILVGPCFVQGYMKGEAGQANVLPQRIKIG